MKNEFATAKHFFDLLYGQQTGVLELRTFDHPKANKLRDFIPVTGGEYDFERVAKFLTGVEAIKKGAFFGVALRTKESISTHKGDAAHCQVLTALFVDADFKHSDETTVRKRIAEFPLPPTMIVCSGGGLHPYWVLDDPILLQIDNGMSKAKSVLRRLAKSVADVVDEAVSEPVRVLRIPGSYNHKKDYELARLVYLEEHPGKPRTYSLHEIEKVIPQDGAFEVDSSGFVIPEVVKQGDRHGILFNLLRSQKARGVSKDAAMACCHAENLVKCNPPIDKAVLDDYLQRCWNQADRPGFKGGSAAGQQGFILNAKQDRIIPNDQDNVRLALNKLGAKLSYDIFSQKPYISYDTYDGMLQDEVRNRLWLQIDKTYGFRPTGEFFDIVLHDLAMSNKFHPVRDYLTQLRWDRVPRVDNWLITSANAADNDYTRAVGALVLIAAVRRVMRPGCKFDEIMVLESEQGFQKSSALRMLCPDDSWFSDDLPLNVDAKQIIERTLGKWIIEAAELSGMHKGQVEHLKSMLSRQVDGPVRMAYARMPVEQARQFVVIGTTNDHAYLNDATGNRRFWPVRVEKFDLDWIRTNRDQLWAEAAHREALGESIRLKPELYGLAELQQERRRAGDPWEEIIYAHFDENYHRIPMEQIWELLGITIDKQNDQYQRRIAKIMQRYGFRKMSVRNAKNRVVKGWGKGEKLIDEPEPEKV